MIEVIPFGTKVRTVLGAIEAIITGVTIRDQSIQYEISYFVNNEYYVVWLRAIEITTDCTDKTSIGFSKQEK